MYCCSQSPKAVIHPKCKQWDEPLGTGMQRALEGNVPKDTVMSQAGTTEYTDRGVSTAPLPWTWGWGEEHLVEKQ